MPIWLLYIIIAVFVVHFIIFSRLAVRDKEIHHILPAITFFLLIISFSMRLFPNTPKVWGIRIFWFPRILSWLLTIFSIYFLIRHKLQQKKKIAKK